MYFGGRTHTPAFQRAWWEWVLAEGIGDGLLAVVLAHEVEHEGFGWLYEWTDGAYEPVVAGSESGYCHVEGEPGGEGAIAAHRIHDHAETLRPARYSGGLVRWGESEPRDDGLAPDHYFDSRTDPPDPR